MRLKFDENETILNFGSQIDMSTVEEQRETLLSAIEAKKNLVFGAQDLKRLDTAGLQLILSFCLTLKKENLTWHWKETSQCLEELADLMGATQVLELKAKRET